MLVSAAIAAVASARRRGEEYENVNGQRFGGGLRPAPGPPGRRGARVILRYVTLYPCTGCCTLYFHYNKFDTYEY